jgi:uncharacterized protein involved in exopolysaccharide biosynthesis
MNEFDSLFTIATKEKTFGDKMEDKAKDEFLNEKKAPYIKELKEQREKKDKLEKQLSKLRNTRLPRLVEINKEMAEKRKKKREEIKQVTERIAELELYLEGK